MSSISLARLAYEDLIHHIFAFLHAQQKNIEKDTTTVIPPTDPSKES